MTDKEISGTGKTMQNIHINMVTWLMTKLTLQCNAESSVFNKWYCADIHMEKKKESWPLPHRDNLSYTVDINMKETKFLEGNIFITVGKTFKNRLPN